VVTQVSANANAASLPPMPPQEEFDMMFEAFLEDLNLPEEKKAQLLKFPQERRWEIMHQHIQEGQEGEEELEDEITEEISSLQEDPSPIILQSLAVSIRAKPIRWISKFVEKDGINVLLNILKNLETDQRFESFFLCIKKISSNTVSTGSLEWRSLLCVASNHL